MLKHAPELILAVFTASMLFFILILAPASTQWEKAHGYPFGRMCNSMFTGWADTCPASMPRH